jgi:hypothetical protein
MNLSYQEKSILGSPGALVLVFGYYFATVLGLAHAFPGGNLARLISAVIVLVMISVGTQIVIAIESEGEVQRPDERDALISSRAYRNAYFVLATGAFLLMWCVIAYGLKPFTTVNLLLFFMVLSEVCKSLTQLFYYHEGL